MFNLSYEGIMRIKYLGREHTMVFVNGVKTKLASGKTVEVEDEYGKKLVGDFADIVIAKGRPKKETQELKNRSEG